jgi:hypothetical protein
MDGTHFQYQFDVTLTVKNRFKNKTEADTDLSYTQSLVF